MIVDALAGLAAGRILPRRQPADGATYAKKLAREEGRLDWRRPAAELDRRIRALNPWPGAWFAHEGARIRVLAARPFEDDAGSAPGTVLDDAPTIVCGTGALRLLRLQRPGKGAMDAAAFLRGYDLPPGTVLPSPEESAP